MAGILVLEKRYQQQRCIHIHIYTCLGIGRMDGLESFRNETRNSKTAMKIGDLMDG